jgi:Tfp pilus assembly protein PilF
MRPNESEPVATNEGLASLLYTAINYQQAGRLADAVALYDQVLLHRPGVSGVHCNRGAALAGLGKLSEAQDSYLRAIALDRGAVDAYNNLGNVLCDLGRPQDAEIALREAVKLKPECALAYSNLGTALEAQGRLAEAEAAYRQAVALDPNLADAYDNLGNLLRQLGQWQASDIALNRAIALNPNDPQAHVNEGVLLLLTGDFDRGWTEYEWRWQAKDALRNVRHVDAPRWHGIEAIAGKTILLQSEQGFGDAIQFCRYAPLVAARGARVILDVDRPLVRLMSAIGGGTAVVAKDEPLPAIDLHCPLMSLPLAFSTRRDTIPSRTPYLAVPEEARRAWQDRLPMNGRPRIGLAWSGRPTHNNDRNRSISLRTLLPLLDCDASFVSLQKDVRPDDMAVLGTRLDVLHFGDQLADFADTAAVIHQLDLVISVDTAVAHLAGALGRPFWLLLPHAPEWRWLLDRNDSPWYPTARLFRQPAAGQWEPVIEQVRMALKGFVGSPGRS